MQMDRGIKNIAAVAIAYLGYLFFSNSKAEVKANALRMQIVDVDVDWYRIRLILNLQNPTSGNIVLRSVVGDLYVNGTKVANVSTFGYWSIPGNGQLQFPLVGNFITRNMVNTIMSFFQGKKRFEIHFVGTINVNSEMMPLEFKHVANNAY